MENKNEDKFKNKSSLQQGFKTRRTLQPINKPSKFINKKLIDQKIVKKCGSNNSVYIRKILPKQSVLKSHSIQGPSTSAIQQHDLKIKPSLKVNKKDPTVACPVSKTLSNKINSSSNSVLKKLNQTSLPSSLTITKREVSKIPISVQRKCANPGKTLNKDSFLEKSKYLLRPSNSENILRKLPNSIICKNKQIVPKQFLIKNKNGNTSNATSVNIKKNSSVLKPQNQINKTAKQIIRSKTSTISQTSKTSIVQKNKISQLPSSISIKSFKKVLPSATKTKICKQSFKENCDEIPTIVTSPKTLQSFSEVPSICDKTCIPIAQKAIRQDVTPLSSKINLSRRVQNPRTSPLLLKSNNIKIFNSRMKILCEIINNPKNPGISHTSSKQLGSKYIVIKKKKLQPRKIDFNQCEPIIENSENESKNIDNTENMDANDKCKSPQVPETSTEETDSENIGLFLNNGYRPHLKEINEESCNQHKFYDIWEKVTPLERKFLTFCVNPAEFEQRTADEIQEIVKNLRKQIL